MLLRPSIGRLVELTVRVRRRRLDTLTAALLRRLTRLAAQQRLERLGQHDPDVVVRDVHRPEERLVVQPPDGVAGPFVGGEAVARQRECAFQPVEDGLAVGGGVLHPLVDAAHLAGDAFLLGLQQVERDGVGVMGLQQPGPFVLQPQPFATKPMGCLGRVDAASLQGRSDVRLDGGAQHIGQFERAVELGDAVFDVGHEQGLLGAGGALLVPAEAHEVQVAVAVAVGRVVDHEAAAALAAEDRGLQVMRVDALLLADPMCVQDGLHALPGGFVNQRQVLARIDLAAPLHLALVVRAAENLVEDVRSHGTAGLLRRRRGAQSPGLQLGGELE